MVPRRGGKLSQAPGRHLPQPSWGGKQLEKGVRASEKNSSLLLLKKQETFGIVRFRAEKVGGLLPGTPPWPKPPLTAHHVAPHMLRRESTSQRPPRWSSAPECLIALSMRPPDAQVPTGLAPGSLPQGVGASGLQGPATGTKAQTCNTQTDFFVAFSRSCPGCYRVICSLFLCVRRPVPLST